LARSLTLSAAPLKTNVAFFCMTSTRPKPGETD
jgi:hypothetical protein